MVISTKKPPPSDDPAAWRALVRAGELGHHAPEAVVAAFQDAGKSDPRLREEMARHLSDLVQRYLRRQVGANKVDGGQDIIDDVQDEFFAANCDPGCADARGYRESFFGRLNFRMKDAIARERRASVLVPPHDAPELPDPSEQADGPSGSQPPSDGPGGSDEGSAPTAAVDHPGPEDGEIVEGDGAAGRGAKRPDPTLLDGVDALLESIDVERALARITDYRKRLAFRYHMERVPFGGTKGTVSIAEALNIDRKTAEHWVAEVRAELLEHAPEVRVLKRRAAGE